MHSAAVSRRRMLAAGGAALGATLLQSPAWALETPPAGSPALAQLLADCQKVID